MHNRLVEELWKLGDNHREIAAKIGCHPGTIYAWIGHDYIPSAYHFANFHHAGMDIIYILTGERHV
jgi:hypothetical protein